MKSKNYTVISVVLTLVVIFFSSCTGRDAEKGSSNLALIASPVSSSGYMTPERMAIINDGVIPDSTEDTRNKSYVFWSRRPADTVWVEYTWQEPVSIDEIHLHWADTNRRIALPASYNIKYRDGDEYLPVNIISGGEIAAGEAVILSIEEIETENLRLEVSNKEEKTSALFEWKVISSDPSAQYAPVTDAGHERSVITGGRTFLNGTYKSVSPVKSTRWKKVSGPGRVSFEDSRSTETTATFSEPGTYTLTFEAKAGRMKESSELIVHAHNPPPEERLNVVYTKKYKIDNPLWNSRAKAIIVNWIPWCIDQINRDDLERGEGGIDNFIEAAKALRGEPHGRHKGYVFSNAWVHQTIESMSIALMVDPQGDKEIIEAQEKMKKTIEEWIPIILSAQESDGYLQTAYTLRDTSRWKERWSPDNRSTHEGYVAGYFIESAINHYTLTEGTDTRLYDAAKKLADCWVDNIGPGPDKQDWYDGHQEMEQALVRFGRFVNDMEGNGRGDAYIDLAKFLLDNRGGGSEYDQSHVPVQQQYEAVGHAVRAVYSYSGMADVAAETADTDYQSAVMSLWDNMVNKKYYVTGGVGSGETSEGFGPDYSLRHNAYCESCSSCGLIFFQYKMNLAYHDAKYADLYEETMYNALLGSLDIEGENFYYTNPMTQRNDRYSWHVCPCCVGNIPRTLLMVPTWTYVTDDNGIYVNLFIGSTIKVENVAGGRDIEMIQETDYPWDGKVNIIINPDKPGNFNINVRIPDRNTSQLYTAIPEVNGISNLTVNGEKVEYNIEKGYAVINRDWEKGDEISFEIPMEIQVITTDERVEANRGLIALRYGPLVFTVENVDQPDIQQAAAEYPLSTEWREDLLDGILTIKGKWEDDSPLLAIPYYARNNRDPEGADKDEDAVSRVWIKRE
ncbi:MAG: glycoside hydrolase family 127 protein [Bacteroidales bacterium]